MKSHIPGITLEAEPIVSSRNIVFRARDAKGLPVIVKILAQEYPTAERIARFRTEYAMITKINGPGVEKALGFHPWDHTFAMVLEHSGPDLRSLIGEEPLEISEFFDIALALVQALRSVHAARIIHKDINPSNICWNRETRELRLIDFGIAVEFEAVSQAAEGSLEGSLPYLAPEQSGRMNRKVDYRSDYYSLGITFHELLAGRLPFHAEDALDWIHQHLTREAQPLDELRADVPKALAAIVSKLIRKNADERYQSTFGILHDLEACRVAWQEGKGSPDSFEAGAHDVSERFAFPQQLYGREAELRALAIDYKSVAFGAQRLTLVLGDTGVGKSALIKNEFRQSLDQRSYFVEGSFEQNMKDTPFFAFRSALQNLAKALLLEQEHELQQLRARFSKVLEGQAGVLLMLAPQLEWIIGPQAAQQDLEGEIARNRCIYLLIQFFKTIAREGRPLVLFLDNLQWADNPSLEFLRKLSSEAGMKSMLTIMAMRDQGLAADEPLSQLINELKSQAQVHTLHLESLPTSAVQAFLAETLACSEERVASLAQLLLEKTNGNPYFLQSLLRHLYEDGKVSFDQEQGVWNWDADAITRLEISDNVIGVILKKLDRLSTETQEILKLCACIGSDFPEDCVLAIKGTLSEAQIRMALHEGVGAGFIVVEDVSKRLYRFQHDQIQEALYSLVKEDERLDAHLLIGRFLTKSFSDASPESHFTEMIRHLNLSISRLQSIEEKLELARFNYRAGVNAYRATAYASACNYLQLALDLSVDQGWKRQYELLYDIHSQYCESLFHAGRTQDAQTIYRAVLKNARSGYDQARLNLLSALQLNILGRLDEALDESLAGMRALGVQLSRKQSPLGVVALYLKIKRQMNADFFENHETRLKPVDDSVRLKMCILRSIALVAYQLKLDNLMATSVALATYYSCRFGFTRESPAAFVNYAALITNVFGELAVAGRLSNLAEKLDRHFDCVEERPYIKFIVASFTYSLHGSYADCLLHSQEGAKWAMQIGDRVHQLYNRMTVITVRNFVYEIDPDLSAMEIRTQSAGQDHSLWIYHLWFMPALSLAGYTEKPTGFDSSYMKESEVLANSTSNPLAFIAFQQFKAMLAVIFEDKPLAFEYGVKAIPVLKAIFGLTEQLMTPYHFLAFSQIYQDLPARKQRKAMRVMRRIHKRVARFASKLPKNLEMLQWLMEAEFARIAGKLEKAAVLYDKAIQSAQHESYTAFVALFNDIAARFYLQTERPRIAGLYFKEAYFYYDVWGAKAKLADLKDRYEELLGDRVLRHEPARTHGTQTTTRTTMGTRHDTAGSDLDLMAVVKASEILASEIVLESLLVKLMRTTMQSSGAQNGTLILKDDSQFHVCAEIREGHESGLLDIPMEKAEHIPRSLIQLALRSNEPVVIDDVSSRSELLSDPYIYQYRPQSILCLPIINRAQICGVIYVEHRSVQGAFTLDRVKVLSVIASQAAIFISNARLYASLEEKVAHRTRELATKTRDIQTMLQNMMQGIFTIKPDGRIHAEYSSYLEKIFGQTGLAERDALELLFEESSLSQDKRMQVQAVVEFCLQGGSALEFAVNEHLLVREFSRTRADGHEQFLEIDWQAIAGDDERIVKLMVVIRDTTEIRELRQEAEQQRRELHVLSRLINIGPQQTERFFSNSREKIAANLDILHTETRVSLEGLKLIFRNLHTIKGNARTLGFSEVADAVHLEEEIYARALQQGGLVQHGQELSEGHQRCVDSIKLYESVYQKTVKGLQTASGVQHSYQAFHDEVGRLLSRVDTIDFRAQIARIHSRYRIEVQSLALSDILRSIRDSLPELAQDLKKTVPDLRVGPCPVRFLPEAADVVSDVMMHCIRNSLDHGIEHPEERRAKGKAEEGCIHIECDLQDDRNWLVIRLHDDGRGMNLKALEERGHKLGLLAPGTPDSVIAKIIFVEGVSTKEDVTTISGRGIGMDAVKTSIEGLGGSITIEFLGAATADRYRPFCFLMALPASVLSLEDEQPSAA